MWFAPALITVSQSRPPCDSCDSATFHQSAEGGESRKVAKVAIPPRSENAQDKAHLARLVARVCRAYDCPDREIAEAIQAALADYDAALICFTDLARQAGMTMSDDRRCCFECVELAGGHCMAARRGEIEGADRRYEPMPYQPRRCIKFKERG